MLSDTDLERFLRDTVASICDSGDLEELTVKRVRAKVEQELSLAQDFFRQAGWKARSKVVIEEEALKRSQAKPIPSIETTQPVETNFPERANTASSTTTNATGKKRKTPDNPKENTDNAGGRMAKRSRHLATVISDDEEEEEEVPVVEKNTNPSPGSSAARENGIRSPTSKTKQPNTKLTTKAGVAPTISEQNVLSDGDLSEVLDDGPVSKRRNQTQSKESPATSKKPAKSKSSKVADPEVEEIKTLQRRLTECGIRKVWGKELKPYEKPRDKIKHLKKMLVDAGMTGRYSKEKAASIREARELAADLEAVQEGAKLWGKHADAAPRWVNKRIRSPVLDFLDDDDDDMMED